MEQSGIFIQFSYNNREICGVDDFKKELDKDYLCQSKEFWLPSCSEGGEFLLKVFFDCSFWNFAAAALQDILIGGVLYCGKKFVLSPLITSLKNFRKANEQAWGLNIQTTTFIYNDIEVAIGGWKESDTDELVSLYKRIAEVKGQINSIGFSLERIEVPYIYNEGQEFWYLDEFREPHVPLDKCIWRLTYQDEAVHYYDSAAGVFLDEGAE